MMCNLGASCFPTRAERTSPPLSVLTSSKAGLAPSTFARSLEAPSVYVGGCCSMMSASSCRTSSFLLSASARSACSARCQERERL
eukprot:scaffold44585_cov35-Tisochrysis_lutea.AAC.1